MRLKIPPALVFIVHFALVWMLSKYLPQAQLQIPGKQILVQVTGTVGVILGLLALGIFRKNRTTVDPMGVEKASSLVNTGVYRLSRNPMYLGLTLILLAWVILRSNWLGIFFVISFLWYLTEFQIKPEEQALGRKFGEEYEQYRRQVRRWI